MNQFVKPPSRTDFTLIDGLLAEVAVRIQLSPTNYNLAIARANALSDWIDRLGSPLHGRVQIVYAQGSMAINATIASRLRTDQFDIDVIAQILTRAGQTPSQILDELYIAIRGERGSRYYDMVERRNRCVTVRYADGMHLDITPAQLAPQRDPRTSVIFHHKPEDRADPVGYALWANPFGFAEWMKACTPASPDFVRIFKARVDSWEAAQLAKADMEPVPAQTPPHEKSMAIVALQLLKRNRNVRFDARPGRRPPSVLLSKFAGDAAAASATLFEQLVRLAQHARTMIWEAHRQGKLLRVTNPRCLDDVLTDRWPASLRDQEIYLQDLDLFIRQLHRLQQEDCGLDEMRQVLGEMFGESVSGEVIAALNDRLGQAVQSGRSYQELGAGRIDLVRSGIAAPAVVSAVTRPSFAAPRHTPFGSEPPK